MSKSPFLLVSAFLLALLCLPAAAQWRCDCTAIVASCGANVSVQSGWVEIKSDHAQCSRVDYLIDGQPFVSVVVDGTQRQDFIARTQPPEVFVQSCQVCRENSSAPAAAPPALPTSRPSQASPDEGAELTPLIEVAPQYPADAQSRGLEGFVDVKFIVTPRGTVEGAEVTASEPPRVFDQAALAAVYRWRYPDDSERAPQTVTRRIGFNLNDYMFQLSARNVSAVDAATGRTSGSRNQCVREQAVYNYGEMIEVGLMNACREPLLVYSCAAGVSPYPGQWVCTDSEESQTLLVSPGDGRVGATTSVRTAGGARNFGYSSDFFVARAPNTQYWWLACMPDDASCRDSARRWVRLVDNQLASIDPQSRASVTIARSN